MCGGDTENYREKGTLGYKFVDLSVNPIRGVNEQEKRPYGKLRSSALSSYKVKKGVRP